MNVEGKINFVDIAFMHGVGKITFVAAVMLRGGANVPAKFAMFTKRRTGISRNMGDDFGARGCKRSAIKVEITVEGSIGRERRVNTGRAEEIQSQASLREEAIPFGERKGGIDGAEDRDEMGFKGPDRTFCGVRTMLFGRQALKGDLIFEKGIFQILGAFIVKDMQVGWMTMMTEVPMCLFPGIANTGSLAIRDWLGMNGIGILMIHDKNIMIAATGRDGKPASLVGVGLDEFLMEKKHGADLMTLGGGKRGRKIIVGKGGDRERKRTSEVEKRSFYNIYEFPYFLYMILEIHIY